MSVWFARYEHPTLGYGNVYSSSHGQIEEKTPQRVFLVLEQLYLHSEPGSELRQLLTEAKIVIYDYHGKGVRYELEPRSGGAVERLRVKFRGWFSRTSEPVPVWRSAPAWGS